MAKINNSTLISGSLPNDYQEVLSWKVTEKPSRAIALNIFGVFLFIIFGVIFSSIAISLGKLPLEGEFSIGLKEISLALAGCLLTLVLHE